MKWILLVFLLISCQDEDMRLFQTGLSSGGGGGYQYPLSPDGRLYVLAFGQSNSLGVYPLELPDPLGMEGDKTNPTNVYVPDGIGGWKLAKFNELPFDDTGNNLHLTCLRELSDKYGFEIRLVFNAVGAQPMSEWLPGNTLFNQIEAIYNEYGTQGNRTNIYKAKIILVHQGEADATQANLWYDTTTEVFQGYRDYGFIVDDNTETAIFGETSWVNNINPWIKLYADDNGYGYVQSDGVEKGDYKHFSGTGYVTMGGRYLDKYDELVGGSPTPMDVERPTNIATTLSYSNLTSSGFTLSWDASVSSSGIVGYRIYNTNGFKIYQDVGNVLTADVTNTFGSGETEFWNVVGLDIYGNASMWDRNDGLEILIP